VTFPTGITPSKGNRAIGSSAVAGMGMASLIHRPAINTATAATRAAGASMPVAGRSQSRIKKAAGISSRPARRRLEIMLSMAPIIGNAADRLKT
jgi:hypothetical protein